MKITNYAIGYSVRKGEESEQQEHFNLDLYVELDEPIRGVSKGGLRSGEVCAVNAEDVLIRSHEVVLTVNGKGKKQRLVTLPSQWVELFQSYLRMWPRSKRLGNQFFW